MRRAAFLGAVLVGGLAASFALGFVHPFGDAGLYSSEAVPAAKLWPMPPVVRAALLEKCGDCHSLAVRAPVYGHFAPASWLMERDINEARHAMNLSAWEKYSADQQQTLMGKIAREVRAGEMPPAQYSLVHWNARMSDAEVKAVSEWALAPGGLTDDAGEPAAGEAARGKTVFEKRCTGCHALDRDREGPRLGDVYGRTSGSVAGYDYSDGLKRAKVVWNDASLNRWLADPDAVVAGNNMEFHVAKGDERADLIAYFKSLRAK
jgi:cytochrome c